MNKQLIANSLCFHGQPLLKIWEGERGAEELENLGIVNPDFSVYNLRQRNLGFADRAKRLKLHQFLAKNAEDLFCNNLLSPVIKKKWDPSEQDQQSETAVSIQVPPFECFTKKHFERSKYVFATLSTLKKNDIIYCTVTSKTNAGVIVKPLCTGGRIFRILEDLNLKCFIPQSNLVPSYDRKGNEIGYAAQDFIRCQVLDISADAERINLGMLYDASIHKTPPFGIISSNNLPDYYKKYSNHPESLYSDFLLHDKKFKNSESLDMLGDEIGLNTTELFSNIKSLKVPFPAQEYAVDLRQAQASKWAFRSVADGIEHFKEGRHTEAFQCLNKALSIDPRNVEGLVARGALYANSSNFHKAINDFETALKLNFYHMNARKYLSETLVALGRNYEDENNFEEASKAYQNCLNINPNHQEAKSSLDNLKLRFDLAIVDNKRSIPKLMTSEEKHFIEKAGDSKGESGKQPYYLSILKNDKSDYDKKVQSFIDVAKDDDDYESRVRKLLLEASNYQKERQKSTTSSSYKDKEKKKKKKSKKDSKKPKDYDIGNAQLAEALKILKTIPIPNLDSEKTLNEGLRKCEVEITNISSNSSSKRERTPSLPQTSRDLTPPLKPFVPKSVSPKPILKPVEQPPIVQKPPQQIVLDKFGCFRLAVPPELESQSQSMGTDSRRGSPSRRSRSPSFRRRRSRSGSYRRDRRRRSRSPYFRNSPPRRRFSPHRRRRRTPSPFDIRRVPRDHRSRTPLSRSRSPLGSNYRGGFRGNRGGNRQRTPISRQRSPFSRHRTPQKRSPIAKTQGSKWEHDKFSEN